MQTWLLELYYELNTLRAGLTKHHLRIGDSGKALFTYCEKGLKIPGQPSMVFIHGFSASKETWLPLVQNIPGGYHCITIDMPGHGETIGLNEEQYTMVKFIDRLKLFFDEMNMVEPMCMIGSSMGSALVAMFAIKYPAYVSMICLLSLPTTLAYETNLMRRVRSGSLQVLLPETTEQFDITSEMLTEKKTYYPRTFIQGYFKSRLRLLEEHKKMLKSFIKDELPNLEQHYEELRFMKSPALILWGREDKVCSVDSTEYFSELIPNSEVVIFEHCGHFIPNDMSVEAANCIKTFFDLHSYDEISQDDIPLE